jgi:lysophospholipase L1-like esterase
MKPHAEPPSPIYQNPAMSRRRLLQAGLSAAALGALGGVASAATAKPPAPQLPKDAVILFQGDSITDAGRKKEVLTANSSKALGTGYAAMLAGLLLADHPDRGIQVHNRGISGNKVPDLAARWKEDAIDLKPTILSILVGINDLWHTIAFGSKYKGTIKDYEEGFRNLIDRSLKEIPGVRVVICEPFTLRKWPEFAPWPGSSLKR